MPTVVLNMTQLRVSRDGLRGRLPAVRSVSHVGLPGAPVTSVAPMPVNAALKVHPIPTAWCAQRTPQTPEFGCAACTAERHGRTAASQQPHAGPSHHHPCSRLSCTLGPQGLHLEDNLITQLPAGAPVLAGLRELLMDWRTALGSPASLAGATSLTRLILNDHLTLEMGTGAHPEAVEALLRTLGLLGALRRIDDVIPEGLQVGRCRVGLGGACVCVEAVGQGLQG